MAVPRRTWVMFFALCAGLIFFFTFVSFYTSSKREKQLRIQKENELSQKLLEMGELQKQITALTQEKEAISSDLSLKNQELEGVQKRLKELESQWSNQARDFDSAKALNATLMAELDSAKATADSLNKKIRALEKEKEELKGTIQHYEEERNAQAATVQVEESSSSVSEESFANEAEIIQNLDTVKLGQIVVQKDTGKAVRIQHINKLYGFIIVNAGKDDGLIKNSVVNIVRDNEIIGKAIIEKLKNNTAAAVTLPEWTKKDIKIGDMISRF